jgi:ribA/ribD-fused uncharacterized protein
MSAVGYSFSPSLLSPPNGAVSPQFGDIVETDDLFLFLHSWPSMSYSTSFHVDADYNSGQQFLSAQKALLFGDIESHNLIMSTSNPYEQWRYGRAIQNFDQTKWDMVAETIAYRGYFARFSQNPYSHKLLLKTQDKIIAEANPYDSIWGIGLDTKNKDCLDFNKWKGRNILGKVIMRVRSDLNH